MSSAADENTIIASLQVAQTDATARIQAAVQAATTEATAQEQVATIQAAAQESVANIEGGWRQSVATTDAQAQIAVANIQSTAQQAVASTEGAWHQAVATTEATATTTAASSNAQATIIAAQARASAETTAATTQANAETTVATTQANAETQVATTRAQADITVATTQANATTTAATTQANAQTTVATTQAAADESVANIQSQASVSAATIHANATTTAATTQATATTTAATIDASWREGVATIQANAQISAATIDATARTTVATTQQDASNYQADQTLAGVNVHESAETGRLQLKLAFAEGIWNELLPAIETTLGIVDGVVTSGGLGFTAQAPRGPTMGFGGTPSNDEIQVGSYSRRIVSGPLGIGRSSLRMGAGDTKTGGIGFASGTSIADAVAATQLPFIDTSGVLTPAQIQQQVNAAYARNDAKAASSALALVQDMTGRGFSANSPILAALQVGLTGENMRASIVAEQQIRLQAAQANAEAVFNSQKAVSDQFIAQEGGTERQVLTPGERVILTPLAPENGQAGGDR